MCHNANSCPDVNGLGLVLETDSNGDQLGIREMIPGDVNADDFVDASDASVLFSQIGTDGTWFDGDLNYDSFVDAGDASVVFGALGQSFDPGFAPAAVPEPSSLGLLIVGLLTLAWPQICTRTTTSAVHCRRRLVGNCLLAKTPPWPARPRSSDKAAAIAPPLVLLSRLVSSRSNSLSLLDCGLSAWGVNSVACCAGAAGGGPSSSGRGRTRSGWRRLGR